jgi:hypothetical protein
VRSCLPRFAGLASGLLVWLFMMFITRSFFMRSSPIIPWVKSLNRPASLETSVQTDTAVYERAIRCEKIYRPNKSRSWVLKVLRGNIAEKRGASLPSISCPAAASQS